MRLRADPHRSQITNGAVYMDNIAPTVCCTIPDAVRCARHELKQLKPRDFSEIILGGFGESGGGT